MASPSVTVYCSYADCVLLFIYLFFLEGFIVSADQASLVSDEASRNLRLEEQPDDNKSSVFSHIFRLSTLL